MLSSRHRVDGVEVDATIQLKGQWRRVDGVEVDAMIQHERAVKF